MANERTTILFEGDFEYPGAIGILSRCGLKVVQGPNGTLIQATQLALTDGTSITNAAEQVFGLAVHRYRLDPTTCVFIEHYAPGVLSYPLDPTGTGTYKVVEFKWTGGIARNPTWKPSTAMEIAAFLTML